MNNFLRLRRTKPLRREEPSTPRPLIAGSQEVSAPGAALRVVRIELTPEGRRLLTGNVPRIA